MDLGDLSISLTRGRGLHPKGGNTRINAQFKAGKTTLVNNLIWSWVKGKNFLGYGPPRKLDGRISLWNYEIDGAQEDAWLADLGFKDDLAAASRVEHFALRGYNVPLLVPHVRDWAIEELRKRETEVWILDPYARAAQGVDIERDNNAVTEWTNAIDEIKRRAGITDFFVVTHSPRVSGERSRGAIRIDEWPDVLWSLTLDNPEDLRSPRFFSAYGRGVDVPEFQLQFHPQGSTGLITRDWEHGSRAENKAAKKDEAKAQGKEDSYRKLLEIVDQRPGVETVELKQAWPGNNSHFGELKNRGIREEELHVHQEGKARKHYRGEATEGCHPGDLLS